MTQPTAPGDARYSTSNTNLAACIGSLKIPVKTEQPITRVRDEDGREITQFWFENQGAEVFCGQIHSALEIERYWKNREAFEIENGTHPLVPMRHALDKRDWLTKAWHGRIIPASSLDKPGFTTTSVIVAACVMAMGYDLISLDKPRYLFRKTPKPILDDIENFELPGYIERPAALMRRALEARKLLVALARNPHVETQLRITDGYVDAEGGRMAFISDKASSRDMEKTLDLLYTP